MPSLVPFLARQLKRLRAGLLELSDHMRAAVPRVVNPVASEATGGHAALEDSGTLDARPDPPLWRWSPGHRSKENDDRYERVHDDHFPTQDAITDEFRQFDHKPGGSPANWRKAVALGCRAAARCLRRFELTDEYNEYERQTHAKEPGHSHRP